MALEFTRRDLLRAMGGALASCALWRVAWAEPLAPMSIKNAIPAAARPLPLSAVRLTGGPLKHAQDLDAQYLLELEPDRMMAFYRERAGLQPRAEGYGGWDGGGRNLTGHIAGHYLSAVSQMWAATGDPRFKERADTLVQEMKEVQDANGDGYLGALEDGHEKFEEVSRGDIRSAGFDLNGLWAPWYVLHKTYAGLRDAYRLTGNQTALDVEIKFAAWAESIVGPLSEEQEQKMLNTEFGGMNEVLADLYADTGDKRWLELSHKFDHRVVLEPLEDGEDNLGGLHGNTQIPKLVGSLSRYIYTGDAKDGAAATFFWDAVVNHHSFATGGHGKDEYFGPADELSARIEGRTAESCNIYNMLKMTRELFAISPNIKFAEFEERALFNHVLGSIDPQDGRTCYMVPIGRGVQHEYQDMFHSFTCCVGTGMENHALLGAGIYYAAPGKLWVNIYAPSTANWQEAGVQITTQTTFPEGEDATLRVATGQPREFALALRRPAWAGEGFAVKVNGEQVEVSAPGTYVEIKREWKDGDTVALRLPKTLHAQPLPDDANRVALIWGPLVLAGDMGPEDEHVVTPVLVTDNQSAARWIKPVNGNFATVGVGHDIENLGAAKEVDLVPFYRLHRRTYSAYFDLLTKADWNERATQIAADQEAHRKLEAATVAFVQPGEMQPERDFNQQGESTEPDRVLGKPARRGDNWFSFDIPVDPAHSMALVVTYNSEEWRPRTFDILVDGEKIAAQEVKRHLPSRFYGVEYTIPDALVKNKEKVTVRFQATNGNEIAAVFGLRMIRADAPR